LKNENLLRSWKEIAAYLGCDRRTCLRWEKRRGLPIQRIEGAFKGSVFAYKKELDHWLHEQSGGAGLPKGNGEDMTRAAGKKSIFNPRHWSRTRLALFHVFFWALIVVAYFVLKDRPLSRVPHDFRIDASSLVVLNGSGREVWHFDTGRKNLLDDKAYRARFQRKALNDRLAGVEPLIAIEDINRDNRLEILFTVKTVDEADEGELICFDYRGHPLWRFEAGRELRFGNQDFSPDYRINGFDLFDLDHDQRPEVLLFATHKPDWPCQFVILDAAGRTKGEFWNSGYFTDFATKDLNGDGREEVIACGVNNEYGKGFLAVFDPADVAGCSPQLQPKFRCADLRPGSEKYYILTPRTDVDIHEHPVDTIEAMFVNKNQEILARTSLSGLYYEFGFAMDLHRVRSTHFFQLKHQKAVDAGLVKSVLNDDYFNKLGRDVLYWDGEAKAWTNRPAMANKW